MTASVFFLVVIAYDRFLAILFPLSRRITRHTAVVIIGFVWAASAGAALPYLFVFEKRQIEWSNGTEVWCEEVWPSYYFLTDDGDCSW